MNVSRHNLTKKARLLEGIRVVDLTWLIQGPIVARVLADYGAEVVKIERPQRPDDMRALAPHLGGKPGVNTSLQFNNLNCGKYCITIDFSKTKGAELVKKLVAISDVVLENFRPGTLKEWGLDYEELKKIKPDIIMASMTGMGQWGPLSKARFLGIHFQAYVGLTHFLGWPDRPVSLINTPYTDFTTPWFALLAISAALCHRHKTGKGQWIDISQAETAAHLVTPAFLDCSVNGRIEQRNGNRSSRAAPHGAYRCKGEDRWCTIAVFDDREWKALCKVMGDPKWTKKQKFATLLGRKTHEDELDKLIEQWTAKHLAEDVMRMLQAARIRAGVVQNGQDLVDVDPQLKHRGHYHRITYPEDYDGICQRAPFRLSRAKSSIQRAGHFLGEMNEYVCTRILGLSDEEFLELHQAGIFGET